MLSERSFVCASQVSHSGWWWPCGSTQTLSGDESRYCGLASEVAADLRVPSRFIIRVSAPWLFHRGGWEVGFL